MSEEKNGRLIIAILDRGWVFIGRSDFGLGLGPVTLINAACIRYWGTKKGIGQLALEGPQQGTVLDEAGTVSFPDHIALIDVDEAKWPDR